MGEALTEIEAISNRDGEMVGVPTGFTDLDSLTNGLHAGQLVMVAARPSLGKSTVALDFCRTASIKHGLTSVIFSLEMSRNEIVMRLLSAEAQVPLQHMRSGTMSESDWSKLAGKMGAVSDAPLFIDDSPNMNLMEIRAKCRRLKQRHDLRLVVVDYLQLMSSGKRVESRQQEVSEFSRSLIAGQGARCSRYRDQPVEPWSGATAQDKRPMLADLRESGSRTGRRTWFYCCTVRTLRTGSRLVPGEANFIVTGHRNGPTATVTVALPGATTHGLSTWRSRNPQPTCPSKDVIFRSQTQRSSPGSLVEPLHPLPRDQERSAR